jgi:Holliday junction resolvasome RuvABC DNA-binding subunit
MKLNYKDFNTLTLKELCKVPGIGRTSAKRICAMRPYKEDNDLFKVKGLGKKTLKNLGIEKKKKERKKWMKHPYEIDDVDYPHSCFARDIKTQDIDFFWRIPRDRRIYLGQEEQSLALIERMKAKKEQENNSKP